jgi:menaquinone-dependent protoporphyrinogen oxidase
MNVLVTVASRHGATREIADAIGRGLAAAGVGAVVLPPGRVTSLDRYDAVILGSAVYAGHWLDEAKRFVERQHEALARRPVWLFSSGPIGDPPVPDTDSVDLAALRELTGARDHRTFPGKLDKGRLGFGERAIARVVRAAEGDYRPWSEIEAWATGIARVLQAVPPG